MCWIVRKSSKLHVRLRFGDDGRLFCWLMRAGGDVDVMADVFLCFGFELVFGGGFRLGPRGSVVTERHYLRLVTSVALGFEFPVWDGWLRIAVEALSF
jgi:hypothetical protein